MDHVEFARVVRHISDRVFELRTAAHDHTTDEPTLAASAIEELAISLGELLIAEEEMRRQRAELASLQARAEADRRLREEARRKDDFLAMVGHELRNPLAAIVMASDLLARELEGVASPTGHWALGVIDRHAGQLGRLVDDLLDLARLSHGKIALKLEDTDLGALVADAVGATQVRADARGIEIAVDVPTRQVLARCDAARVRQVLCNLLDNAIKYTPRGGHVAVSLASTDEAAFLSVRDDGIGMTPDLLERVFALYEQASGADRPSDSGLGVGLALVRQLVELHRGRVEARSEGDGKGSEFVVELPRRQRASAPRPSSADDEVATSAAPMRVVVVDDDPDLAEMLGLALGSLGHHVAVQTSGTDAVARVREVGCDLAIIDLGMPGMSGLELAARLRELAPDAVLIAMTGFTDDQHRSAARGARFDHYHVKPIDLRALRALVRAIERERRGAPAT